MNIIQSILNTSEQTSWTFVIITATSAFWLFILYLVFSYANKAFINAQKTINGLQGEIQHYRTGGMVTSESMGKRVALVYVAESAITPMHWGIGATKRDGAFVRPETLETRLFFRFEMIDNMTECDALDLAMPMDGETFLNSIELTARRDKAKVGRDQTSD